MNQLDSSNNNVPVERPVGNDGFEVSTDVTKSKVNPAWVYLLSLSEGSSREGMKANLNRAARFFGYTSLNDCPWHLMGVTHLVAIKACLERDNKSPSTINTMLAALKGVSRASWQQGLITDHDLKLVESVKKFKGDRLPRGRALTMEESAALFQVCNDGTVKGIRDTAIFSMGIGLGLRRSEIASAKVADLDLPNKKLSLIGKGNKERFVYGPDSVWENLAKWMKVRGTHYGENIFCRVDKLGKIFPQYPLQNVSVFMLMTRRAKEANIKVFSPHDLRRTYASRMLEAGADILVVKKALGHVSVNTTQLYDCRGDEKVRLFAKNISL